MGPAPAVAAVRAAVRAALTDLPAGPVAVACSGGADSLALLAATVAETRRRRGGTARRVLGVTVDHGLQEGSAERADVVVGRMATLGVDETMTARVRVEAAGRGIEAAAREARYAVLEEVADRTGSRAVLLGHTLDDQAETVLLGLTRGSGGRSIAGMRRSYGPFLRPLLDTTRAETEAACRAEGITVWHDPHNQDPRFTRARVRARVLPVLEEELGPGVAVTLARTADSLREDMELLDGLADAAYAEGRRDDAGPGTRVALDVPHLAALAPALRRRVLHRAALDAGAPGSELFRVHVLALEQLVVAWRGQREVQLPGHLRGTRSGDTLRLAAAPVRG